MFSIENMINMLRDFNMLKLHIPLGQNKILLYVLQEMFW